MFVAGTFFHLLVFDVGILFRVVILYSGSQPFFFYRMHGFGFHFSIQVLLWYMGCNTHFSFYSRNRWLCNVYIASTWDKGFYKSSTTHAYENFWVVVKKFSVEHRFSVNKNLLSVKIEAKSIISRCIIVDHVRSVGGIAKVQIDKEILRYAC